MDNFNTLYEWMPVLIKGSGLALGIGVISLIISLVFGMVIALFRLSSSSFLRIIGTSYTTVVRGIPELVLILLLFYGGQQMINSFIVPRIGVSEIDFDPFTFGAVVIGLIYTAYMAETLRGAILAVPAGQLEAAKAYGLGKVRIFVRITFPQMIRHALPGISNNWLVMLKATALVSLISLKDVVFFAYKAASQTGYFFTFLLFAGAVFLLFTTVSVIIFRYLELRYSLGFVRKH